MATRSRKPVTTLAVALVAASLAMGCGSLRTRVPVKPPPAALVEIFSAPAETNFENAPVGSKEGKASAHFFQDPILTGLSVTWGDGSIEAAAENGGLSKVHYVDYELLSILGIYVQLTVKASGD